MTFLERRFVFEGEAETSEGLKMEGGTDYTRQRIEKLKQKIGLSVTADEARNLLSNNMENSTPEAAVGVQAALGHLKPYISEKISNAEEVLNAVKIDSVIGPLTQAGVRLFQEAWNAKHSEETDQQIVVDGIPGPITKEKMREVLGKQGGTGNSGQAQPSNTDKLEGGAGSDILVGQGENLTQLLQAMIDLEPITNLTDLNGHISSQISSIEQKDDIFVLRDTNIPLFKLNKDQNGTVVSVEFFKYQRNGNQIQKLPSVTKEIDQGGNFIKNESLEQIDKRQKLEFIKMINDLNRFNTYPEILNYLKTGNQGIVETTDYANNREETTFTHLKLNQPLLIISNKNNESNLITIPQYTLQGNNLISLPQIIKKVNPDGSLTTMQKVKLH